MDTALEAWLSEHPDRGDEVRRTIVDEIDRLFGTALAKGGLDGPRACLEDHLRTVAHRLVRDAGGHGPLLTWLAPDQKRGVASLVEALAEILFVPRRQRAEYRRNTQVSAPWDIRRLLLEYAFWSRRVDDLLGALTKPFCASRCERLPTGCCSILGYDMGMVPEAMLQAQELEARGRGWSAPAVERRCKYHGADGCRLRLFKSPACAGMLCEPLEADLLSRYPQPAVGGFLRALARYRNHGLDRAEIFDLMHEVVTRGRLLMR